MGPVHPRCIGERRRDLHGVAGFRAGRDSEGLQAAAEAEAGHDRPVTRRSVLQLPGDILRLTVKPASVAHYIAFYGFDPRRADQLLPFGESLLQGESHTVPRSDSGIAPSDDIEVTLQNPVLDASAIGQPCPETIIRSKFIERQTGCKDFDVGGRHHTRARIVLCDASATDLHSPDTPDGFLQLIRGLQLLYVFLNGILALGQQGSGNHCKESHQQSSHITQI